MPFKTLSPPNQLENSKTLITKISQVLKSLLTVHGSMPWAILALTKSTTSWFVKTSQIPSQAITINS